MDERLSRRGFLQTLGATGLLVGGGTLLSGCVHGSATAGSSTSRAAGTDVRAGSPRRGGILRVGILGAGKSETFNPSGAASNYINMAHTCAVFDPLVNIGPTLKPEAALATSWHANTDSTEWTFVLRNGVTWHDGSKLTPADVVYTLNWATKTSLAGSIANVDLKRVRTSGNTVIVPLNQPDLLLPERLGNIWIVKDGTTDFTKPIGTGPFKFVSLTPGEQSVCVRNAHYWNAPKPYVDKLIVQSIDDDSARYNALVSGQIDLLCSMPLAQAKAAENSNQIHLLNTPSISAQAFYMAVDTPPFTDVRVRQAIKLLADRQQLVDVALDGFGAVGNDLFGIGLPYYDASLPQRKQNVEKAKVLLAAAGHGSGLDVTLQTAPASPGMVEAATLFKQQAKAGGVNVTISQVDAGSYFDPSLKYLKMPFAQSIWSGFNNLSDFYSYALTPKGAGNETHWHDKATVDLINKASSASSQAQAARYWDQIQKQQYEEGGYLWWAAVNNVDACSTKVAGISPSKYLAMGLPGSLTDAYFTA